MRVVNDIAERGLALMEEYNKLYTTNEEQKQYLLLLVKQYRNKCPDTKISFVFFLKNTNFQRLVATPKTYPKIIKKTLFSHEYEQNVRVPP
jgi:hypothetical protein